jgi:hypothetical protein
MMRVRALAALLLSSALVIAGCTSEEGLSGPSAPELSPLLGTGIGTGLLACTPLPFASASQVVGPEGGTLTVGPHSLTIPAGALAAPVTISAEAPVGTVNAVRLGPEGLHFAPGKPARLTLSYANCPLTAQLLPKRIAYTDDLLRILSYLLSVDDLLRERVTAPLEHFSRYVVAW